MPGDPGFDGLKGGVVVEFPSECGDVFGGTALEQEAALVVVKAESHHAGKCFVEVHSDRFAAEAAPVGEFLGLDDQVAQVDFAEHIHAVAGFVSGATKFDLGDRKSVTS